MLNLSKTKISSSKKTFPCKWTKKNFSNEPLPKKSQIVIIGGGVIGCSVGYHLMKSGFASVTLLEQAVLTAGTTWHAAGLIGQMRATETEIELSKYGAELYGSLEEETGQDTGFRRVGAINVARSDDRMHHLKLNYSSARAFDIEAKLITPDEIKEMCPILRVDDLVGGLYLPGDGNATSSDVCNALAKGAKMRGMVVHERVRVVKINTKNVHGKMKIASVETNKGDVIECDILINCAGQWARQLGNLSVPNVNIPLHSAEHFYAITKPFGISKNLPVIRDTDGYLYAREWSGGLLFGGFEPRGKPCFTNGVPDNFEFGLFDEDWDHFGIIMESAMQRFPDLEHVEIRQMINGPESFTPDTHYILGEAPEIGNYYVAAGFNSSGIASAAGAGKLLTDMITEGYMTKNYWSIDIRRFSKLQGNPNFLRDRISETLGIHYAMAWPRRELQSSRPLRRSAVYEILKRNGACFGSKMGWERANWFGEKGTEPELKYSFGRDNSFDYVLKECLHTRKKVTVFDQTSFAKFLVQGRDALEVMQKLCCNNVDVSVGGIVYTGMLNYKGGYETDCTISRLSHDSFFVVSSTSQAIRDMDWITRNIPHESMCTVTDVTSSYSVFGVMGPQSRELLNNVSNTDLSDKAFPFGTFQDISVNYSTVRASRITYVGELGWELYVPTEFSVTVMESLFQAANETNIQLECGGYYAIESLRIEKGYRAWGHDIASDRTPIEAGMKFTVDFTKDFIGKAALELQVTNGVTKKLFNILFEDNTVYPLGKEPIILNNKMVGYISSASHGYTVGTPVALGYIYQPSGFPKGFLKNKKFTVEIAGVQTPVKLSHKSAYDNLITSQNQA